jgi:DNA primase
MKIIIVEGRADVINLLSLRLTRNPVAVEGVKIPRSIAGLTRREKRVIAFLDGDRGGDLILQELLQNCKIDAVARAPYGKEVEQLTAKEVHEALEHAVPPEEALKAREYVEKKSLPVDLKSFAKDVEGSLTAVLLNSEGQEVARMPVSELAMKLAGEKSVKYVVFDGVVTQRLVDAAASLGGEVYLVGVRVGELQNRPPNVYVLTMNELA